MSTIEINPGEIKFSFESPVIGKTNLSTLGMESLTSLEGGLMRMVFNLTNIGEHHYYKSPTIEISYDKNVAATHWQCDFNGTTILDTIDNHGSKTILLLDRKKLSELEHHHVNKLVIHAEFPEVVNIVAEESSINFFK